MNTFDYVRPSTVRDAVAAASAPGAAYLAAGTNLLDLMKGGIAGPSRLIDISRLPGLDRIETLADGETLHPVQAAFIAHDGMQCGFCTPGQIMSAVGLIAEGQSGGEPERVRELMSGNLCRCSAYKGITEAVLDAHTTVNAAKRKDAA